MNLDLSFHFLNILVFLLIFFEFFFIKKFLWYRNNINPAKNSHRNINNVNNTDWEKLNILDRKCSFEVRMIKNTVYKEIRNENIIIETNDGIQMETSNENNNDGYE